MVGLIAGCSLRRDRLTRLLEQVSDDLDELPRSDRERQKGVGLFVARESAMRLRRPSRDDDERKVHAKGAGSHAP